MNSTTVDYSTADQPQNMRSYKGKQVAERHAREWASWNPIVSDNPNPDLGEVFEATYWNGSENLPIWLVYDISATDEGWTITAYRWYHDPRQEA